MQALLLRCREGVEYHLGTGSLEDVSELLHADTLFSALANVYAAAYGAAEEWVDHVRSGRVRISSGLHCAELSWREQPVFFVPRPPLRYAATLDDPLRARRLRHIRHVSLGVLAEIRAGLQAAEVDEVPVCTLDLLGLPRIGEAYACTAAEIAPVTPEELPPHPLCRTLARPRVEIRTPEPQDTYYHAAGLSFAPLALADGRSVRGHFYVMVEHALDAAQWRRFLACVRMLADEGVGGERSSGYGWFQEVRLVTAPAEPAGPGAGLHLSLAPVIPADDAELGSALHYELFSRGGGSLGEHGDPQLHRRRVRMLREGALFRGSVRGSIVDVSPTRNPLPHPVLRSGVNFPLSLEPAT